MLEDDPPRVLLVASAVGADPKPQAFADYLLDNGIIVTSMSASDVETCMSSKKSACDLTKMDFVLWYQASSAVVRSPRLVEAIGRLEIPVLVVDGPGFPISQALGLIDSDVPAVERAAVRDVKSCEQLRKEACDADERNRVIPCRVPCVCEKYPARSDGACAHGRTHESNYPHEKLFTVDDAGFGNGMHFLLLGSDAMTWDRSLDDSFLVGKSYFNFSGEVNAVQLSDDPDEETALTKYTRPLLVTGDLVVEDEVSPFAGPNYPQYHYWHLDNNGEVVLLVNDRRRIVVSGITNVSNYPQMNDSCDGSSLFDRILLYLTEVDPSLSPLGQNVFSEVDLEVPAQGFNFTVQRTYTSGLSNAYSYMGRSWTNNHDQWILWDKYNDRLTMLGAGGKPVQMELVQGQGPELPADAVPLGSDVLMFTTVNSERSDIAAFYPAGSGNPDTLPNPDLRGACTAQRHTFAQSPLGPSTVKITLEGFVVRGRDGSKAFFARHPLRSQRPNPQSDNNYALQEPRIRGGEIAYYRIAYIEDAGGHRMRYYYEKPDRGSCTGPECLLECVVDTEGRGFGFETSWEAPSKGGGRAVPGTYSPWLSRIVPPQWSGLPVIEYLPDEEGSRYGRVLGQVVRGGQVFHTFHYGLTDSAGKDSEDSPALVNRHFSLPLRSIDDGTGREVQRFVYDPPRRDATQTECGAYLLCLGGSSCSYQWDVYYPGRLRTVFSGAASDPGGPTMTRLYYHEEPGVGDRNNLTRAYAWISAVKNGAVSTDYVNARYHVINHLEWYLPGRANAKVPGSPWAPPPGTALTDANIKSIVAELEALFPTLPGVAPASANVAACAAGANLSDETWKSFDPLTACRTGTRLDGWLWSFKTNYDGAVTQEVSPTGKRTLHYHHLDKVVYGMSRLYFLGMSWDARMLAFWKQYWHLRHWLTSERTLMTVGTDGVYDLVQIDYEPIFNRPIRTTHNGQEEASYRYDYFEDGPLTAGQLLALMGMSLAPTNTDGSVKRPAGFADPLSQIPWINGTGGDAGLCNRTGAPVSAEKTAGQLICQIAPATSAISVGSVTSPGRARAAELYAYDGAGRSVWSKDRIGRVMLTDNKAWPANNLMLLRTIQATGVGGGNTPHVTVEKVDSRGLIIEKRRSDGFGQTVVEAMAYNSLGQLTQTEIRSDSAVESRETISYDRAGNMIRRQIERCVGLSGEALSSCRDANAVGEDKLHRAAYDSQNRLIASCEQTGFNDNGVPLYVCARSYYNADDQLSGETASGFCAIPESGAYSASLIALVDRCPVESVKFLQYDGDHRHVSTVISSPNGSEARTYNTFLDPDGLDIGSGDPMGRRSKTERDGLGRAVRVITGIPSGTWTPDAQSTAVAYTRDSFGRPIVETTGAPSSADRSTDKALGHVLYQYDARGDKILDTVYVYPLGAPSTAAAVQTVFARDQRGAVTAVNEVGPGSTPAYTKRSNTVYDAYGDVLRTRDYPSSSGVDYSRDHLGRVISETRLGYRTDMSGSISTTTEYVYNARGQVVSSVNVSGDELQETQVFYDGMGLPYVTIDPKGQVTSNSYDGRGKNLAVVEFVEGNYFENGSLLSYNSITNTAEYDALGRLVLRADAEDNATQWTYNVFGEVAEEILPNGYTKEFTRNGGGAIRAKRDSDNRNWALTLDRFDRPTAVRDNGALSQRFQYYNNGLLQHAEDYNLAADELPLADRTVKTDRTWNTLGQMLTDQTQVGTAPAKTVTGVYVGTRQTSLVLPSSTTNKTVNYVYNANKPGLLDKVQVGTADLATYTWVGPRLLQRNVMINPSNAAPTLVTSRLQGRAPRYDGFGRLAGERTFVQKGSSQIDLFGFGYEYNQNNRLVAENDEVGQDLDAEYVLDDLDRVLSLTGPAGDKQYRLDESNNVRQIHAPDVSDPAQATEFEISANGMNQISAVGYPGSQERRTLTYDNRGNLVRESQGSTSRGFTFDDQGRLARVNTPHNGNDNQTEYYYDALNRRVAKLFWEEGALDETVTYALWGGDVVEEEHTLASPGLSWLRVVIPDPTATDKYLRLAIYNKSGSSWILDTTHVPAQDIRNNVIAQVSSNGAVAVRSDYDLYGNPVHTTVNGQALSSANQPTFERIFPYAYAGREWDPETDFSYYRTRYYWPHIGRFISVDTIGIWGDLNNYGNGYAYVGNMANGLLDPTGMTFGDRYGIDGGMPPSWTRDMTPHSPEEAAFQEFVVWGLGTFASAGIAPASEGLAIALEIAQTLTGVALNCQQAYENFDAAPAAPAPATPAAPADQTPAGQAPSNPPTDPTPSNGGQPGKGKGNGNGNGNNPAAPADPNQTPADPNNPPDDCPDCVYNPATGQWEPPPDPNQSVPGNRPTPDGEGGDPITPEDIRNGLRRGMKPPPQPTWGADRWEGTALYSSDPQIMTDEIRNGIFRPRRTGSGGGGGWPIDPKGDELGGVHNGPFDPEDLDEDTGVVKEQNPGKPPFDRDECGGFYRNVPSGVYGPAGRTMEDTISLLMRIDPNLGGAIDPTPFVMSNPLFIRTAPQSSAISVPNLRPTN